ncbi:MAG: GNAT family N-acetyltransferase [Archangiaceae bacterium]|nr:GNAT family N-acetyltransferase [Archangiaceae bacterium]
MELRPVTAADVPEVIALVSQTLREFGLEFGKGSPTDANLYQLPKSYHDDGGEFFVAREGGVLLGTAGVVRTGPQVFELRKMYLAPASRGKGVGKQLLEACVRFCREQGARQVTLDTTEAMVQAIAFYERNGFVRDDSKIRGARCSRGYRLDL